MLSTSSMAIRTDVSVSAFSKFCFSLYICQPASGTSIFSCLRISVRVWYGFLVLPAFT